MKKLILVSAVCGVGKSTNCEYIRNNNLLENYAIFDIDDLENINDYNQNTYNTFYENAIKKAIILSGDKNIIICSCINPRDIEKINMPKEIESYKNILITCSDEEITRRLKERDESRNCSNDEFIQVQIDYQRFMLNHLNLYDFHIDNTDRRVNETSSGIVSFIKNNNTSMKSILVTGGACAGKTTSLEIIENYLKEEGYKVIIIDEVPTELIKKGISYEKTGKLEFMDLVIKTQINNEEECFKKYGGDEKTIVVFDGSPIDSLKFISEDELESILKKYDLNIDRIINRYDAIIFLQTIAKKYPELYSNANNAARLMDVNLAVERNDRLEKYYNKYEKTSVIECEKDISIKNDNILKAVEMIIAKN